jgi:hypothetical protein
VKENIKCRLICRACGMARLHATGDGLKGGVNLFTVVDLFSQFTRTFEGDDFSFPQDQIAARGGISAPTLVFGFYAKFSKPGNEDILIVFQIAFDDFKQRLNHVNGLLFGKTQLMNFGHDVVFC